MLVKDGEMLVNDDELLVSPSLMSISPSLTSILIALAWIKPSFTHLTNEKLHQLLSTPKFTYLLAY